MSDWRISSASFENLDLAIRHGTWGAATPRDLKSLTPGDRLALVCSSGASGGRSRQGYWALATVTRGVHESSKRVWPDDLYPYRIRFKVNLMLERPLDSPIAHSVLKAAGLRG